MEILWKIQGEQLLSDKAAVMSYYTIELTVH